MSLGQHDNYLILEFTKLKEENASLKAEVDLWKLRSDNWQKYVQLLEDERQRLRKAGDAMAEECENFQGTWKLLDAWKQAKEGKPSV